MYRWRCHGPEILLVHPGGPYFKNKDHGAWGVPKGEADLGEAGAQLLDVAKREFQEETGIKAEGNFHYLGRLSQGGRKTVEVWAFEGDCDPAAVVSNTILIEWPPRSGKQLEIPEVDRAQFFTLEEARGKLFSYQLPLLDLLQQHLVPHRQT
jgi:predicted NUDIX family NTP pyrophosphohydrolase